MHVALYLFILFIYLFIYVYIYIYLFIYLEATAQCGLFSVFTCVFINLFLFIYLIMYLFIYCVAGDCTGWIIFQYSQVYLINYLFLLFSNLIIHLFIYLQVTAQGGLFPVFASVFRPALRAYKNFSPVLILSSKHAKTPLWYSPSLSATPKKYYYFPGYIVLYWFPQHTSYLIHSFIDDC